MKNFKTNQNKFNENIAKKGVNIFFHNGEPVTTVKEIVKTYGCKNNIVRECRERLYPGMDYSYLMGNELKKFKESNNLSKNMSNTYIFYRSGLRKIKKYLERRGF